MSVSDQQESVLRALLAGDTREAGELTAAIPPEENPALLLLLQAGLVLTAHRYFAPAYDSGDVVRYVARLRAGLLSGRDLDPRSAETVLRRALGEPVKGPADDRAWVPAVPALLTVLASDLPLSGSERDEALREATALALRWQSVPPQEQQCEIRDGEAEEGSGTDAKGQALEDQLLLHEVTSRAEAEGKGGASSEAGPLDRNADKQRMSAIEQRIEALEEREARRDAEHKSDIGQVTAEIRALAARIDALEAHQS